MMKKLTAIFTIILSLATFAAADENVAPANDNFSGAQTIALNGNPIVVTANNTDATKETGEPDHADNTGGKSVWFNFTPAATINVRINVMQTNFDTLLAVYTGQSVNDLTFVGSNDNCSNTCEGASTVDLMLVGGQTYRIAVDGVNHGSGASSGTFNLAILSLAEPFQDNLENAYDLGNNFTGSIAGTNYNATAEPGEQVHMGGNPATKSVWYRWRPDGNYSVDFELTDNYWSIISVWSSNVQNPTHAQLTRVAVESDGTAYLFNKYRVTFFAQSNKYYFIAVDGRANETPDFGNFQLKFYGHRFEHSLKLSSSERATISVFRPGDRVWYSRLPFSQPNYKPFGNNGDEPMPADFNGDGLTDIAVTRNENGKKVWYISKFLISTDYYGVQWGLATDKPIVGDFDRDGVGDIGAIRQTPNGLVWYIRHSSDLSMRVIYWGVNTDKPVLGDFDGDGMTDAAVTRIQNGALIWYILKSGFGTGTLYTQSRVEQFGLNGDLAAVADFDTDRKTDITVFRPSNGTWYILRSTDGAMQAVQFGSSGDIPQPADYDGDGTVSVGVFRPSNGTWYTSTNPATNYDAVIWGSAGDIPVTSIAQIAQ